MRIITTVNTAVASAAERAAWHWNNVRHALLPSSTGGEAGVGAGALQPNGLFVTAVVLPHVCCRCKFDFK